MAKPGVFFNSSGFTMLELMVAIAVLTVGLLGVMMLQDTAIRTNEANRRHMIAHDAATREIEFVRTMGYQSLRDNTVLQSSMNYIRNFEDLDKKYAFSTGMKTCGQPYEYCVFKGISTLKEVEGKTQEYDYAYKLAMDTDYLTNPILARGSLTVYWMSRGALKNMNIDFFVEAK